MTGHGRDRLRELLDAVLHEEHDDLAAMARGAHVSPFHFSRQLADAAGESPVTMRRRVMLERAAWQLRHGESVTDAAWAAGYESTDGFARAFGRAFGCAPSRLPTSGHHWLPAPNGIHFHPPTSLWVTAEEQRMDALTQQLVEHDIDDTSALLDLVSTVSPADYRAARMKGAVVLEWDGAEESLASLLSHHVRSKEVWVAAIAGEDLPAEGDDSPRALVERHERTAPRWLDVVRDIDHRGAWNDRIVDALCDPPESFVLSSVVAHVLTFGAHRRLSARQVLRGLGHAVDHGDPILWHRARSIGE
ncbi:MAG: helix-turn-helix transcriptional regulator [Nocardioides sp.]